MDTPPNPKRPCLDVSSSSIQRNPNSALNFNFDSTVSSFLLLPDSPSTWIASSFDRVPGQVLSSASGDEDRIIDRTSKLGLLLHESTKRFNLKRAFLHNNNSWSLPQDLTIKVFSMIDTKSVIRAASCCTMFREWAKDPSCYAHIDLIMAKHVNDEVVCSMICRAGNELRSLKLGRVACKGVPSLSSSALASVFSNKGFNGDLLTSVHIHNIVSMAVNSLDTLLSVCPNLTDLKIVDIDNKFILGEVLKTLSRDNRISKLKHLFLEKRINFTASGIDSSTAEAFVTSCPDLTSLTLIGFELKGYIARKLVLGFPELKYMDLSRTGSIGPWFLWSLGDIYRDNPLETLILPGFEGFGK